MAEKFRWRADQIRSTNPQALSRLQIKIPEVAGRRAMRVGATSYALHRMDANGWEKNKSNSTQSKMSLEKAH